MGVGIFPETNPSLHYLASLIAFLFYGVSATLSFKLSKPPVSYFSLVLGVFSLAATALFSSGVYLGLGPGGMERMILYPVIIWGLVLAGSLSVD
jgi:hypothetical membrane protein